MAICFSCSDDKSLASFGAAAADDVLDCAAACAAAADDDTANTAARPSGAGEGCLLSVS